MSDFPSEEYQANAGSAEPTIDTLLVMLAQEPDPERREQILTKIVKTWTKNFGEISGLPLQKKIVEKLLELLAEQTEPARRSEIQDEIVAQIYDVLRDRAKASMKNARQVTLQPTALVHETIAKFLEKDLFVEFAKRNRVDRNDLIAYVTVAMNRDLLNYYRSRKSTIQSLDDAAFDGIVHRLEQLDLIDLLSIKECLLRLKETNEHWFDVFHKRAYQGMTFREIGKSINRSEQRANQIFVVAVRHLRLCLQSEEATDA